MISTPKVLLLATIGTASAWCGICDNAPSRSWNWWFGFGECKCHDNWSDRCCATWSVNDWEKKVADWSRGESCEAQPGQACARPQTNSPAPVKHTQKWKHEPSETLTTEAQCVQNYCMWVECSEAKSSGSTLGTPPADEMCSQCDGPWAGKCEWNHYKPGVLAFAGPGEHCGFKYPVCPERVAKHCFCGEAAVQELRAGWCNNGAGMSTFCPAAMDHGDGRSQACTWNGWQIWPQHGGDIEETCSRWGF